MANRITVIVGMASVLVVLLGGVFNLSQSVNDLKNISRENGAAVDRNCLVLKQLDQDIRLHIIGTIRRLRRTDLGLPPVDC